MIIKEQKSVCSTSCKNLDQPNFIYHLFKAKHLYEKNILNHISFKFENVLHSIYKPKTCSSLNRIDNKNIRKSASFSMIADDNSIIQTVDHFLQLMYQSEDQLSRYDALQLKNQPKFQCLLENKEELVLSTNIFKYNNEGKCQQRILVITNTSILNILKSENIIKTFMKKFINFQNKYEIKRRILLSNLYGITITPNRNSNVFLIHVINEHDYHYRAQNNKMIILKVISDEYKKLTKNSLQFFFKDQKQIGNYLTTKSHLKQKKDVKPKDNPLFLKDDYFLDKKIDNQVYVCQYSHKNQNVQPTNFKRVDLKDIKNGQTYFILKQEFNRSVHVKNLSKEQILLNPYYTFYSQKKQLLFIPFMVGGNLRNFLSNKIPLGKTDLIFYLKQILIFLLEFHEKAKIYGNITLQNLLVKQNGYLMLNGLQKSIQQIIDKKPSYKVFGNPFYFPPEVVECRGYRAQIDVWKLGICAYFLCKGSYPFQGRSIKQLYYNIIHKSIQNENIPDFVKVMLEKDKEKRIKVGELLDLNEFNNENIDLMKKQLIKAPFLAGKNNWQTIPTIYQLDHKQKNDQQ